MQYSNGYAALFKSLCLVMAREYNLDACIGTAASLTCRNTTDLALAPLI